MSRALDLDGGTVTTCVRSQTTNGVILKIDNDFSMPMFDVANRNNVVTNLSSVVPTVNDAGGAVLVLNSTNLPLFKEVGLWSFSCFPPPESHLIFYLLSWIHLLDYFYFIRGWTSPSGGG